MLGLICQKSLNDFWRAPGEVDHRLYQRYRGYLVEHVLANGNFYRRVRGDRGATGVNWPFGSVSAATDPARAGMRPPVVVKEQPAAAYVGGVVEVAVSANAQDVDEANQDCWVGAQPQETQASWFHP